MDNNEDWMTHLCARTPLLRAYAISDVNESLCRFALNLLKNPFSSWSGTTAQILLFFFASVIHSKTSWFELRPQKTRVSGSSSSFQQRLLLMVKLMLTSSLLQTPFAASMTSQKVLIQLPVLCSSEFPCMTCLKIREFHSSLKQQFQSWGSDI